jgi:WXG100 family type VII secretion target
MDHLGVDADQAYNTSRAVGNDAQELREELAGLQRDRENLSREWSGVASSAYSAIWGEWLEGATTLVHALAESSHDLGVAAVSYSEQDADSAAALRSTPIDMGFNALSGRTRRIAGVRRPTAVLRTTSRGHRGSGRRTDRHLARHMVGQRRGSASHTARRVDGRCSSDAGGDRAASSRRRQRASALHRRCAAERGNAVVTIQDVDTETFYAVGKGLFEKAGKLYDAFNVNVTILGGTGSMAGTDDAGKAWATSYDERVKEVLGAANDLSKALENYGGVVMQAGYNHAVAATRVPRRPCRRSPRVRPVSCRHRRRRAVRAGVLWTPLG